MKPAYVSTREMRTYVDMGVEGPLGGRQYTTVFSSLACTYAKIIARAYADLQSR